MAELFELTATEAGALMEKGEISSEDLVKSCLARIEDDAAPEDFPISKESSQRRVTVTSALEPSRFSETSTRAGRIPPSRSVSAS